VRWFHSETRFGVYVAQRSLLGEAEQCGAEIICLEVYHAWEDGDVFTSSHGYGVRLCVVLEHGTLAMHPIVRHLDMLRSGASNRRLYSCSYTAGMQLLELIWQTSIPLAWLFRESGRKSSKQEYLGLPNLSGNRKELHRGKDCWGYSGHAGCRYRACLVRRFSDLDKYQQTTYFAGI
jgi:hypothetical protein